ncbi:MAG: hypothetical protein IPI22_06605 [Bacteroidetes bacterium]|nr:hypothetical protein [Bacteroidota bacterium]
MLFSQIVGQQELKEKIIYLINEGRLPHAINLLGHEGSGHLALAMAIAQYINCKQKTPTDSCGVCASCIKIQKLQHPDVHFSFPTISIAKKPPSTSKDFIVPFREFIAQNPYGTDTEWLDFLGKEKQGNITALECRDIIQKLLLRSFESEYKILIMWYPEYLGKEGNILLKLIEEPTPNTILIFVTTVVDHLLLTIQSRTQLFPLKRLSDAEIQEGLIRKGLDPSKALMYARIAEGNYNEALKLSNDVEDEWLMITRNWLNALFSNNGLQLVQWVMEMADGSKEHQKKFLTYFIQLLEHAFRIKHIGSSHLALLEGELKLVTTLLQKGVDEKEIPQLIPILNDAIYHIERNANSKILFHHISLQVQQVLIPALHEK